MVLSHLLGALSKACRSLRTLIWCPVERASVRSSIPNIFNAALCGAGRTFSKGEQYHRCSALRATTCRALWRSHSTYIFREAAPAHDSHPAKEGQIFLQCNRFDKLLSACNPPNAYSQHMKCQKMVCGACLCARVWHAPLFLRLEPHQLRLHV